MEDGRITAAGYALWALPGQPPVWRLNPDGSPDASFALAPVNGLLGRLSDLDQLSVAPDGRALVYGYFDDGTNAKEAQARLKEDGSIDFSFDPGSGLKPRSASSYVVVDAIAPLPQGGWLVGGDFGGYDGFNQSNLVKILPESLVRPLTFQFAVTNLTVWETNGLLTLQVWRHGDASGPASVTVRTQEGTAIGNQNFTPLDLRLDFAPGEWSKTVSVGILQDHIVTDTEQFAIQLVNPDGGFGLAEASVVTVQIRNNDAAVEFVSDQFHAFEQDGFAVIGVHWIGATAAGMQAAVNVTAVTGSSTDLWAWSAAFAYRSRATNWVRFPIVTAPQHQEQRQFRLDLAAGTGVLAGAQSNATLVIDDLDFATTPARGVGGVVEAVANSPEGGLYVAGDFTGVHGVSRVRVARLAPDGEVDLTFNPGAGPNSNVTAIAVQPDGDVVIAGAFAAVDGLMRAGVARLRTDGSVDENFDPGSGPRYTNDTAFITVLLPQPEGKLLVAGRFTHFANHYSRLVTRLLPDGSVDDTFTSPFAPRLSYPPPPVPIADQSVIYVMTQQPDGKIIAGGAYLYVYQPAYFLVGTIARFNTD
ncbi:MAG: Calx-beta domain-containing protein, partial [Limisphaerales bacterium]